MLIRRNILYDIIQKMPIKPPEEGGIIGGSNGVVTVCAFDEGDHGCGCIYRPNVDFLNDVIAKWSDEGIDFFGIFHTHFGGASRLSLGDERYIEKIMKSMPLSVKKLYFPIVVQPNGNLVAYLATIDNEKNVTIKMDELEII